MKSKYNVLVSAPYFQPFIGKFRGIFEKHGIKIILPQVKERLGEKELFKYAGAIDGAICGDDAFTEKVLKAAAPRLKVISKWGTGIDSINQKVCKELGIIVKNTPDAFTQAVADSVMGYILCFARNIPWMDKRLKGGIWQKTTGYSLHERTLGIIGVGNIGKAVVKRAVAFGMRALGNDIRPMPKDFIRKTGIKMTEKNYIYKHADFISLNCDLNPTSRYLLKKEAFRQMKRKPVIINTARGGIIKEKDLIFALKAGLISGAALDVFETEPVCRDNPLLKMDNVLLAPHNTNSSPAAWENVHQKTIRNLLEVLDNA